MRPLTHQESVTEIPGESCLGIDGIAAAPEKAGTEKWIPKL
jgi:hypothetical protein